jgi:hypothetical protein
MTVLGIDIGRSGAAPLLDESGAFVAIHDMPTLDDRPKGIPAVNAPLLAQIVAGPARPSPTSSELARDPTDGAVQTFAFGRALWPPSAFLWLS